MLFLFRKQEPKVISSSPLELDLDTKIFQNYKVEKDKLIIKQSGFNWILIIEGLFGFMLLLYIFSNISFSSKRFFVISIIINIVVTMFSLYFVYLFLQGLLSCKKIFIFDRANGTLTYSNVGWFCLKTIPFNNAHFQILDRSHRRYGIKIIEDYRLILRCKIKSFYCEIYNNDNTIAEPQYTLLSLFVWYMDKNRPLPPGKIFDPFRQEDYERRRSEDFPKPLYTSYIKMLDLDGKKIRNKI